MRWLEKRLAAPALAILSLTLGFAAGREPLRAAEIKNSACLDCHGDATLTTTNGAGRQISLFMDAARLAASVHGTNACVSCHADITLKHPDDNVPARPAECAQCHQRQSVSYGTSVHGIAAREGVPGSATCADCHDGHTILPPTSPESPLHYSKLAATCGACHPTEANDFARSVHGRALAAGQRDAPTCTDCHSEHSIQGLKGSSPLKISVDVCSKCHASERLNTKYNLPPDRVKTFFQSYHGLAAQYGSTVAANCASCHGVHNILPSSDPDSTINPAHLVQTCGQCHPGATDNFALGKIHVDAQAKSADGGLAGQVNWWVRRFYLWLIGLVIGGMLLHNGLALAKKIAAIARARQRDVLRMTLSQRVQHVLLGLSFVVLALTGFALKFPDSWIARALGSSEPFRRWAHRVAGAAMLLLGLWHIGYALCSKEGRKLVRDFLPKWKDFTDVLQNALYFVGLRHDKAKFARFGYPEKMEYWAMIWGIIVMGGTGLAIWFKIPFTRFLPRWIVDVALTIHYYEAILACLAIVVWHFYHVIFDPDVFPMNWACWDGYVSTHWQEEEHPLEQIAGNKEAANAVPVPAPALSPPETAERL